MQERSITMSDEVMQFILYGLTDKQKELYRTAIKQIEEKGVDAYVLIFPENCKNGWSLIRIGYGIAGGSHGAPLPLGYPVVGPYEGGA